MEVGVRQLSADEKWFEIAADEVAFAQRVAFAIGEDKLAGITDGSALVTPGRQRPQRQLREFQRAPGCFGFERSESKLPVNVFGKLSDDGDRAPLEIHAVPEQAEELSFAHRKRRGHDDKDLRLAFGLFHQPLRLVAIENDLLLRLVARPRHKRARIEEQLALAV